MTREARQVLAELWDASAKGLTFERADELASHIMRSRWMKAVRLHAKETP